MAWVEVRAKSVEEAVQAAMAELGIERREDAEIQVIEDAVKGFLGMGGREALVRVSTKPQQEKRRRNRKRGGRGRGDGPRDAKRDGGSEQRGGRDRESKSRQSGAPRGDRGSRESASEQGERGGRPPRQRRQEQRQKERSMDETPAEEVDVEAQAGVVGEFLEGLVDSFGLDGTVATRVEDDVIIADLTGEQTEALVGAKGVIMQSVGELTRTVVQRKTHRRARLRLDIGGYLERRREALRIYTSKLAAQVLSEGGELMLEPMNPADRKVVHDAVVEIDGVRSFSEGEEPKRSVVIALAPGVEPTGAGEDVDEDEPAEQEDEIDTDDDNGENDEED